VDTVWENKLEKERKKGLFIDNTVKSPTHLVDNTLKRKAFPHNKATIFTHPIHNLGIELLLNVVHGIF
jgi:hypothetical protein